MDNGTTRRGRLFIARPSAETGRTGKASASGTAQYSRITVERAEDRMDCKEQQNTAYPEHATNKATVILHEPSNRESDIPETAEEIIQETAGLAPDSNQIAETAYREPGTFEPEDGPDSAVSAPYRRDGDGFDYSHGARGSLSSRLRSGRLAEWLSSGKVALVAAIAAYVLVKYVLLGCIS